MLNKSEDHAWFVRGESGDLGPLSAHVLRQLVEQHKLQPHDELRQGQSGTWRQASQVRGLFPEPDQAASQLRRLTSVSKLNRRLAMAVLVLLLIVVGFSIDKFGLGSAAEAKPRKQAEHYFAEAEKLIRSDASLMLGIEQLELAFDSEPDFPGLRELMKLSMRSAVENLRSADQFKDAVQMARRVHELEPSAEHLLLVQGAEFAAAGELHEIVQITAPTGGQILESGEVTVQGRIASELFSCEISIAGESIQIIGSAFEHHITGLKDGPQSITLSVSDSTGFTLPVTVPFFVDTQSPEVVMDYPKPGDVVPGFFVVQGTVRDTSATHVSLFGQSVEVAPDGSWALELSKPDGIYAETLLVTDAVNRTTSLLLPITVDSKAPLLDDLGQGLKIVLAAGDDLTCMRLEDEFLDDVVFNDQRVSFDDEGYVYLRTPVGDDEAAWSSYELIATDKAGNVLRAVLQARRDMTAPRVHSVIEVADVFPNSVYLLSGEFEDGSACGLSLNGGEMTQLRESPFSIPVSIPPNSFVGDRIRLTYEVADAAGNNTKGRAVLNVVEPCQACVALDGQRGLCAECGGSAVRGAPCKNRNCVEGLSTDPCAICQGTGKKACSVCNQTGKSAKQTCTVCDGHYKQDCPACSGKGRYRATCVRCKGSGRYTVAFGLRRTLKCPTKMWRTCKTCDGRKKVYCSSCTRGKVSPGCTKCVDGWINEACFQCEGQAVTTQTCPRCHGEGERTLDCKLCAGSGECKACLGSGLANVALRKMDDLIPEADGATEAGD